MLRVAGMLDDQAAVAYEHGHEELGDILTAEARMLRSDDLSTLLSHARDAVQSSKVQSTTTFSMSSAGPDDDDDDFTGPESVEALRELRLKQNAAQKHTNAVRTRAEEIIEECWLRVGYSSPPVTALQA